MKFIKHFPRTNRDSLDYCNEILNDLVVKFPNHSDLIWYFRK